MQIAKNKTTAIAIAIFLMLSMTASTMPVPNANAHSPAWTIISYAYMTVEPNLVGVGQTVDVCMWVDAPMVSAALGNDIRRHDYTLTITKPDGTTQTQNWPVISDSTGVQFYRYTPDQVGNYTFTFNYPAQTYIWSGTYQNDTYAASSRVQTLTVQQEPLPASIDSYPLPTEYWTRPIEEQNTYWYSIASNWLGSPYIIGAGSAYIGGEQPYGSAPTSAHVMWTKPIQYGGVVGGNDTNVPGETYYEGLSYNPRFGNPIIMQGTLFYELPYGNSGTGGDYVAVDLRTGQEQWRINASATGTSLVPSFGYLYSMDQPNQHGILPNGLLIATTTVSGQGTVWRGYDPMTGVLTTMNVTNVPTGESVAGPAGEYLKIALVNYGTTATPNYYLQEWNSSKVFGIYAGTGTSYWYSGTENASLPSCYDWNVSVNLGGTGWSVGTGGRGLFPLVSLGNLALMIQGTFGGHVGDSGATVTTDPANITAISLNPSTLGQVLWKQSYPQAPGNNTRFLYAWDPTNGVFIFTDKETFANWGYSLANGQYLWGPSYPPASSSVDWNFPIWYTEFCQYGNLYSDGFSGLLYCWNDKTGVLQWTYGNGGPGNSTNSGFITPYGFYPEFVEALGDGKIYIVGDEHSPNSPMYKGSLLRCINATNGAELWTIFGWGNRMSGTCGAIADGYLTVYNPYDGQIYSYGKGPSALTVEAPMADITAGNSLVIRGTVTDIAAGTKQNEQAARFPNGVPAVSVASMSSWMEYVYMQKPRPANATGVPVTLDAVDPNGNFVHIGTATSDTSGLFSYEWKTPDVPGKYTVIATFAGSESYWPSYAETAMAVQEPAATPTPAPAAQPLPPIETYFIVATVVIVIAIAIVGLMILRKRP
jgi:hypothetical protein